MRKLIIALLTSGCLMASTPAMAGSQQPPSDTVFERFAPAQSLTDDQLDWQHWDEALGWMVIPMGPSLRQGASRVDPNIGTRRIYGHESRLRLEGNRVAFSYLTAQMVASLTEYRADLERIGSTLDIARLPRNEQLAYWLNLHNVAIIEALAKAHPMTDLDARTFGPNEAPLGDAKLVTVAGVALSARDIREKIVYPHWRDPKVIYGFWRGQIGGPSIQRVAFTGSNVDTLLALAGEEFVNSLRGVEAYGGALRVSRVYEEAAPFYFGDDRLLRNHISKFAGKDVASLLQKYNRVSYADFETDIADLARGERDPNLGARYVADCKANSCIDSAAPGAQGALPPTISVNPAIARLMRERGEKLARAQRKGIRLGTVIVAGGDYTTGTQAREVE